MQHAVGSLQLLVPGFQTEVPGFQTESGVVIGLTVFSNQAALAGVPQPKVYGQIDATTESLVDK